MPFGIVGVLLVILLILVLIFSLVSYLAQSVVVALAAFFVLVCVFMILMILIQRPKGGGLAGAFGVGRLLESVLVQTSPTDPVTLVSVVAVLGGAAVLACLWPARRAAHLNPSAALRYE